MKPSYRKEACVENFKEATVAVDRGADQIELCSLLHLDGCTPLLNDVARCLDQLEVHTKVMIRPSVGSMSFHLPVEIYQVMKDDIIAMKDYQVEEVVFGLTTSDHRLDLQRIAQLRDLAYPMAVTIHKAIDTSVDILSDLQALKELGGIKSVLTSGGHPTAAEGSSILKEMITIAGDEIEIIPAGKITPDNIEALHSTLLASTYHGRKIV